MVWFSLKRAVETQLFNEIRNCLLQGNGLTPLLFNFPLEHTIRKVYENQERLKLNGTHKLLVYADDTVLYVYMKRK
jgi:hypothetical protein